MFNFTMVMDGKSEMLKRLIEAFKSLENSSVSLPDSTGNLLVVKKMEAALRLVDNFRFAAIILDADSQGSLSEFLSGLAHFSPYTPVIVLTANPNRLFLSPQIVATIGKGSSGPVLQEQLKKALVLCSYNQTWDYMHA